MTLYKQDHRRRIDGDIIVARESLFTELGVVLATTWTAFAEAQQALQAIAAERTDALTELSELRSVRDAQYDDLCALYSWGYSHLVWPCFSDWRSSSDLPQLRPKVFPGGAPSHAYRSRQWMVDAVAASLAALAAGRAGGLPSSCLPPSWVQELTATLAGYRNSMSEISMAKAASDQAFLDIEAVRSQWDQCYRVLVANTKFALAQQGQSERFSLLIPAVAKAPDASLESVVSDPVDEAEVLELEVVEALEPEEVEEVFPLPDEAAA